MNPMTSLGGGPGSPGGAGEGVTNLPSTSNSCTPAPPPDSTHQPYSAPFTEGEDILVHDADGLIYFGVVVEVDQDLGQCLVRFGDCTERWSNFFELRRLGGEEEAGAEQEAEKGTSKISNGTASPLPTSIEQLHQELAAVQAEQCVEVPERVLASRGQLSYDWETLEWDEAHQRNKTETYCYCGEKGEWYKRMLQCCDCLQWFHQECIRALSHQLMCGDRFFKFTCTLCNGTQEETIERLDLGIVDALHLVIFNLIISKNQKFHDLNTSIIPFVKKKLKYLTDNGTSSNIKPGRLEAEQISKILANNKSRFKCGSETGQQSSFWGLRRMLAPWLPSRYREYKPRFCTVVSNQKRLKETLIQPNNKKGVFHRRKPVAAVRGGKRGRPGRDQDSDTDSAVGTLELLIKTPVDFSGLNHPFREFGRRGLGSSGDTTPSTGSDTSSQVKLELGWIKQEPSPTSSGPASNVNTEECRAEMLQSVEEMLGSAPAGSASQDSSVFKTPGLISDLGASLTSYFSLPTARTRIHRGDQFRVQAKRLTLNGDIAYLLDWDTPGQYKEEPAES